MKMATWLAVAFGLLQAPWRDPSSHQARFVTVDSSVRLEVLDWGGSGTPARRSFSHFDSVPDAKIVELPGANLYMFLSNEADIIRELRAFASSLPVI